MTLTDTIEDTTLLRRIRAEFDELPGMRLTFKQAARLMGVDDLACSLALDGLIRAGYLTKHGQVYLRASDYCCV